MFIKNLILHFGLYETLFLHFFLNDLYCKPDLFKYLFLIKLISISVLFLQTYNIVSKLQNHFYLYGYICSIKNIYNMAVEASKVKARLRALFPKANLSTKRLDEISDKLGKKIEDNATDAQIDEAVTEQNELYSFEEIAKNDDRARTERKKEEPKTEPKEQDQLDEEQMPAWAKQLVDTVNAFKAEKQAQTLEQRFKSDERLKNVNPVLFKGRIPTSEDGFEDAIEDLLKDAQELKLNNYGGDTPASGDSKKPVEVKEISADDAKNIVKSMGINV